MPIKLAAKVDPADQEYFEREIEPLLEHERVDFVGEIGGDDKRELLSHARALLFPIDWAEPFGLVMIEAMACGTPVIAYRSGSVPEVIDEGVNGFIVDDIDGAVEAVSRLDELDRAAVRATFEKRFTVDRMARDYVALYEKLIGHETTAVEASPRTGAHVGAV
jgi:glycosyltransferase involved in cell wall biosynthesis